MSQTYVKLLTIDQKDEETLAEKQEDKENIKDKVCTHIKKTTKTKTFKVADRNNVKIVDETIFRSFYDLGDNKNDKDIKGCPPFKKVQFF